MTDVPDVPDFEQIDAMPLGPEKVKAAQVAVEELEELVKVARRMRNAYVREMVAEHGPSKTARLTGLSLSTVKGIQGTL